MTVGEKQKAIQKYCDTDQITCIGCPLYELEGSCYEDLSLVEKNYDILFDSDTTPEKENKSNKFFNFDDLQKSLVNLGDDVDNPPDETEHTEQIKRLKELTPKPEDPIKPSYYNDTKFSPFDVIDDWELNFYLGNAVKYIKRAGKKANNSRLQDLKKIREYIDHEIAMEEVSG